MTSSGVIITDTGFQNCSIYDVVAFDPQTNSYVQAQPNWAMENDTIKPANEAYVAGIVCSVPDTTGSAQLLINGVIEIIGKYEEAGEYYLAADGEMEKGTPTGVLPVYCGYRNSAGQFIFKPSAPAYAGHRHTVYTLSGGTWSETSTGTYTYDDTNDPTCQQLLASVPVNTLIAVVGGGIVNPINLVNGKITYVGSAPPADYTIYGTNPLATIEPDVRSVAPVTNNNTIIATKAYGTVYLDLQFPNTNNTAYTGTALTGLANTGITTAPVVHVLNEGTGVELVPAEDQAGVYTLNAGTIGGTMLDFQTINANNVLVTATGDGPLLTFPANINSSVIGIARIPLSDIPWNFRVFVWVSGVSDALTLTVCIQDPPSENASVNIAAAKDAEVIAGGGTQNQLTQLTSTEYSAAGNALVTVNVAANSPGNAINIKAFGLLLDNNASGSSN